MLGRRFKSYYEYMIAAAYLAISILCTSSTDCMAEYEDAGFVMIVKLIGYMIWWVQLLAPSIHFVIFYAGVHVVCLTYIVLHHHEELTIFLGFGVFILVSYFTFWYLLHSRELRRFYQQ